MCDLPTEVADEEIIVRGIMCPSHVKQGKPAIKAAAFKSRPGTDDVSVIRHSHMGSDFCKSKAKEIANDRAAYAGLAWISARDIRSAGSKVLDSRSEFCGHAHIEHGMVAPTLPPNEPPEGPIFEAITERCQALVKLAKYHHDPKPEAQEWAAPPIG